MTVDQLVERGAERLEELSEQAAHRGGVAAKLAEPLAEDAEFLRRLKPSLIRARAKGHAPTDGTPGAAPRVQSEPQLHAQPPEGKPEPDAAPTAHEPVRGPKPKPKRSGGPSPFVVAGAAFAVGVLLAKWIDWRGHAHPRL